MNTSNSTPPAALFSLAPSDGERAGVRGSSSLASPAQTRSELLILADGTILAHNLTPALAAVLQVLAPQDETLKLRSASAPVPERGHSCPQQRPIVSPPRALCPPAPNRNSKI